MMAFESLGDKLKGVFNKLTGRGTLSEKDIKEAMRQVRLALLEADVNYKVTKEFVAKVSEKAMGAEVMKSLTPGQQVIKIVQQELTELMGGTQADYEQWALEVPGVTRAFVTQEMGRGTVTVRFMMDGTYPDGVPKDGDRQAVAAHIETVRPVTADVYVVLPVADPLNLRLRITPDTAAIRLAAEANLWAAVRRDAVPGGTIFLSRLHEALSLTEKEEDHVILSPTANVTPETGHIVVPGSIEWVTE